jgi:amidase
VEDVRDGFTRSQLEQVAWRWSLSFDQREADALLDAVEGVRAAYARVAALAESSLPSTHPPPAQPALPGGDPYNAWLWRIPAAESSADGVLSGRRLVIKDCIAVAGVPMTLGGSLLKDYVPDVDATAVARARDAGATIVGTAVCEDLCTSGSSFTSVTGAVRNPYDPERSSGGSTSGCAVLVAVGEADLALGTDQGGSVRNPAAWSGVCGLKPTFGLVPYTGAFPFEFTLDHIGALAREASDIAKLLDAIAGPTETDPRQCHLPASPGSYTETLTQGMSGVRVGVVKEGFAWPGVSDPENDEACQRAVRALKSLGAVVGDVSVPLHRHANELHVPVALEGSLATIFEQNSQGSNRLGYFDPELASAFSNALHTGADHLPLNAKISLLAASVLREATGSSVLAQAENLRGVLRQQYDSALEDFDVLVMPSVPMPAHVLPSARVSPTEHHRISFEMHRNNCALNLTGHPAMNVPCGLVRGLPVGLMIIGRHFDERTVLRVAHQYQSNVYPCPSPPGVSARPGSTAKAVGDQKQ